MRAVGVGGAGIPGLAVARTDRIAYGVTNSYGDAIDLFIEREDPANRDHYLEGDQSVPFEIIEDSVRVRERGSATGFRDMPLRIRLTHRGPVISDHGMGAAGRDAAVPALDGARGRCGPMTAAAPTSCSPAVSPKRGGRSGA